MLLVEIAQLGPVQVDGHVVLIGQRVLYVLDSLVGVVVEDVRAHEVECLLDRCTRVRCECVDCMFADRCRYCIEVWK